MPSASSAKSVKTPSVPPADTRPPTTTATMKTTKNTVAVAATNADCAEVAAVVDATNSVPVTSVTTTTSCAAGPTSNVTGGSSGSGSSSNVATPLANTSAENHASSGVSTPIKQTLVIIEHKIRNLEKRKTKLESYRAIQASGKELSSDQKQAVSKYDEVMQCLEFARDLTKQMMQLSNNAEKEQKKLARREAVVRAQAEALKIREVLTIQNILNQFENDVVREDFLNGTNGATKLEENDMNMLEKFYCDINIKRQESPEDPPFLVSAQKAADLFSFTIDGRPKPYYDTTFENMRRIFQTIQDCGYFDQAGKVETTEEEMVAEGEDVEQAENEEIFDDQQATGEPEIAMEMVTEDMVQMQISQGQQDIVVLTEVQQYEAPSAAAVPAPAFPQAAPLLQAPQVQPAALLGAGQLPPPQAQLQRPVLVSSVVPAAAVASAGIVSQQSSQVAQVPPNAVPPNAANAIHGGHFPATTVRAVEQGYYKQHQYIQQMRPLAEVIGSTNFYFLQESELDSPDLVAPGGFSTSDGQPVAAVISGSGVLSQQSPAGVPQQLLQAQQQQPQPAQQPQIALSQQAGLQSKSQPGPAPNITSQTFTNPSFPPIVPQQAPPMFQPAVVQTVDLANAAQQQPPPQLQQVVYTPQSSSGGGPGGIQIQSLLATPQAVVSQQQAQPQLMNSMVDSQTVADVISQQAAANIVNLMSGPGGVSVAMPAFVPSKFHQPPQNAAMVGVHPATITQMPGKDSLEAIQQQSQQQANELKHSQMDDLKENRGPKNDSSQDWDAHEPHVQQKSHTQALSSRPDDESNQWSNEVTTSSANSSKHDWNSNYDNQNDSNTWKSMSNDAYGGRNAGGGRNSYSNNNRGSGGGSGRGGPGLRGNNAGGGSGNGGPPSNGYRGRSNNYQQQQNNRNAGMYFRNSDNYYQNQNGNGGGYGNKDTSNNYVSGGPNNNYRPRGTVPPNSRQQGGPRLGGPPNSGNGPSQPQSNRNNAGGAGGQNPNRSANVGGGNMSTNPNTRSGRNNPGNTYGSSRPPPPNNVRQQDINA